MNPIHHAITMGLLGWMTILIGGCADATVDAGPGEDRPIAAQLTASTQPAPTTPTPPPEPSIAPRDQSVEDLDEAKQRAAEILQAYESYDAEQIRLLLATESEQEAFSPGTIMGGEWHPSPDPTTWIRLGYHVGPTTNRIFRRFYFKGGRLQLVTEAHIAMLTLDHLSARPKWENFLLPTHDSRVFRWGGNLDRSLTDHQVYEHADQLYDLVRTRVGRQ